MDNNEEYKEEIETLSNEEIISKYNFFISGHPTLLPRGPEFKETVFETIEEKYKKMVIENPGINKDDVRNMSLSTLFTGYEQLQAYIDQETLREPLDITLNTNPNSNLFNFFTQILWFTLPSSFKENGDINTSVIKKQVDIDLNRADMTINGKNIDRNEFITQRTVDDAADYFNLMLMNIINDQGIPILMNTIILTDLCRIQQCIQYCLDTIVSDLKKKKIYQGGEAGKGTTSLNYNIILNNLEQSVECILSSALLQIDGMDVLIGGSIKCYFKVNILDLTYSLRIIIDPPKPEEMVLASESPTQQQEIQQNQNYLRNFGTNAIDYTKQNPGTVAAAAGVSSVLAAGVGTLLAVGILGGKTKKRLNKNKTKKYKRRNNKTKKNKRRNNKTYKKFGNKRINK